MNLQTSSAPQILLASASPRRRELLQQLEVTFRVAPADIDETVNKNESPECYVKRMAREKARAGFIQSRGRLPILAADTIVVLHGQILGKPLSTENAESMLRRLSGQTHQVYSAVALAPGAEDIKHTLNITAVTFGKMPQAWVTAYCQGAEPMDKAGAYAVQGGAGQYIKLIEGSYSGVMGLPLYETAKLLRQAGLLV